MGRFRKRNKKPIVTNRHQDMPVLSFEDNPKVHYVYLQNLLWEEKNSGKRYYIGYLYPERINPYKIYLDDFDTWKRAKKSSALTRLGRGNRGK